MNGIDKTRDNRNYYDPLQPIFINHDDSYLCSLTIDQKDIREIKIVEFCDPIPVSPSWIEELKPKKVLVRDVATNEIFKVAESKIDWVAKGDKEAVFFVKRRHQQ